MVLLIYTTKNDTYIYKTEKGIKRDGTFVQHFYQYLQQCASHMLPHQLSQGRECGHILTHQRQVGGADLNQTRLVDRPELGTSTLNITQFKLELNHGQLV